jgi:hypothetical protein
MTCQHMMTLGVYLLGALDPTERSAFESHLSYCEICRGELIRLAPLPGLLNQIALEDFAENLPPTGLEGVAVATQAQPVTEPMPLPLPLPRVEDVTDVTDVTATPETPGPPRYWRVAAAAAAVVVLAVGGVFGWSVWREDVTPAAGVTWSASEGSTSVEARLVDHEWGTAIQSKVHGLPPGKNCYVVVYDHYGQKEIAGWWGTDHDPNEEIPSATSIMRSKIDRLEYMVEDKDGKNRTVVFTIEAPR